MKLHSIEEPLLEFSQDTHIDVRFGIAHYRPFDSAHDTSPSEIKVGLLGTQASVQSLSRWLANVSEGVAGKPSQRVNFHPAFPGFSENSCFGARLVMDERWTGTLSQKDVDELVALPPSEIVARSVEQTLSLARQLLSNNSLDVIVCAPPDDLLLALDEAVASTITAEDPDEIEEDNETENKEYTHAPYHDLLKARGMALGVPLQMVRPPTYGEKATKRKSGRQRGSLQDEATRAWNFFTALYYKAGGIPWRLKRDPSSFASCYAGISFFRSLDGERMLTSVAQVFNERGEGIIVKGAEAQKTQQDRQPHLNEEDSYRLIHDAIQTFFHEHRHMPARLVVHKTSKFAPSERAGIQSAANEHHIELLDLITIDRSSTRLFRIGTNPPLRGTLLELAADRGILYLKGSVGFYEMYPGNYVPRPVELRIAKSESTMHDIADEIVALSKLNWNNTQFDGGEPITVRAARQVGDILKCLPSESDQFQRGFRFYM